MNQQLVAQARAGEIAIGNDGTVDELTKILKHCWPKDVEPVGSEMYYMILDENHDKWGGQNYKPEVPVVSVKEFFKQEWEPKEGDMVQCSDDQKDWYGPEKYLGKTNHIKTPHCVYGAGGCASQWAFVRPFTPPLEITLEEAETLLGELKKRKVKIKI